MSFGSLAGSAGISVAQQGGFLAANKALAATGIGQAPPTVDPDDAAEDTATGTALTTINSMLPAIGSAPGVPTATVTPATYGAIATETASTTAVTSTTVGGVTLGASNAAGASANVGGTSAAAQASEGAILSAALQPAPGVTVGAQAFAGASAAASVGLDSSGLHINASATAGVAASAGVAYTTGTSAGTVNASSSVNALEGAQASVSGSSVSTHAGNYVTANVQGGLSGSDGSVSGGATVAAPGSLGVSASAPTVGYSNGNLTFGASAELDLGVVGVGISFNVGINVDTLASAAEDVGMAFLAGSNGPAGLILSQYESTFDDPNLDTGSKVAFAIDDAPLLVASLPLLAVSEVASEIYDNRYAILGGLETAGQGIENFGYSVKNGFEEAFNDVGNFFKSLFSGW
jgi:hypothetical protein